MYRHLSELLVRAADLAEAEGRLLRRIAARFGLGMSLVLVASALLLIGAAFLIAGVWFGAQPTIGSAWASVLCGVLALVLASGVLLIAAKLTK